LLKNLVTNFEPQSIQTAVDRLLQTAESGKAILPAFPKKDLATAYQGSSVLDAIALPLSFASTQTTMQYCFLKFIILWYGQQKYVIQEHANFHPDLKRALWPSLIPAEWPGEQVLGYLLGKLRTGKHPLRFLSDSEFMRRLQADLAPRLKGRARGEQIAGDAWYPGSCAGIRSRQAGRGHEAVTASAACSRCAILGGSVGHSMLCPRYALAD
jgi:hypothetical protein